MKIADAFTIRGRVDWKTERERVDLAAVATRLLGPAPGRRGERGRKLWWSCPFHEDGNPSFAIEPGKPWWRCYGCGESGDAANLVMRLGSMSFPDAVAYLTGDATPLTVRGIAEKRPSAAPQPQPSGLPEADALAIVEASAERLWTPEGAKAVAYLTGPHRGLSPETIRSARLGWTPRELAPTKDGRTYPVCGIVVPWFRGDRLALVKVRQLDGHRPKYAEIYRDPDRLVCYPDPAAIRPGKPLVVTEGEFDALALAEVLGELASVVTLGGASSRPEPHILRAMLPASPWYIATDGDDAGDLAAGKWPESSRRVRVRPPGGHKDWCEARAAGVNLARWWAERIAGNPAPALFAWDDLASLRWGGADPSPGIVVDRPDRALMLAALRAAHDDAEERAAIRGEPTSVPSSPAPGVPGRSPDATAADVRRMLAAGRPK